MQSWPNTPWVTYRSRCFVGEDSYYKRIYMGYCIWYIVGIWIQTVHTTTDSIGHMVIPIFPTNLPPSDWDQWFWSNYSDLTRPHPKWWFSKVNPLISGKSRLVKYYNLTRMIGISGLQKKNMTIHGGGRIAILPPPNENQNPLRSEKTA